MQVDTDTFAAITAESAMLREHARRAAPGRHRRPPRPRGQHPPERGMDRWWRGGYTAAMGDVVALATEAARRPGSHPAEALAAVVEQAAAVVELHYADTPPAAWLDGAGGGQ